MIINILLERVLPGLLAAIIVWCIHRTSVKIALIKNIVDQPNARKLNKQPIPILGGIEIYIAVTIATFLCCGHIFDKQLLVVFAGCLLMLSIGVADDILDVRPKIKFVCEIIAVCMIMFLGDLRIDSFHGLWGIYSLPDWVSYPLTLVATVGIINAINMIDGVDGLSSGFGILSSFVCGLSFIYLNNAAYAVLAFAVCGALIPFFIFNIFSHRFKMYIGDSGSLTLGFLSAVFVIRLMQDSVVESNPSASFVLAIYAIPVFDTIRVMSTRIAKGNSPFMPDKTHLHHLFIDLGFGHRWTTMNILIICMSIVAIWFGLFFSGVEYSNIFNSILFIGILFTFGMSYINNYFKNHASVGYNKIVRRIAVTERVRKHTVSKKVRHIIDHKNNK